MRPVESKTAILEELVLWYESLGLHPKGEDGIAVSHVSVY